MQTIAIIKSKMVLVIEGRINMYIIAFGINLFVIRLNGLQIGL